MRYELSDYEWSVIKPMLPNKPRGVPRVDAGSALRRFVNLEQSPAQAPSFGSGTACRTAEGSTSAAEGRGARAG